VDAVEVVKKRVDFVNFQAVSCLQNVKSILVSIKSLIFSAHFDLNFDLRNNIEEIENFLGLDAIEVLRLDTESVFLFLFQA